MKKGFKLLKATLSHVKDIQVTSFSLVAKKANYNEENRIYEIISEIRKPVGSIDGNI